ncbi:hypothetical protein Bhyg_11815 [Pseudolycoriella hygida]|uniref:Uncharacterized protein n=1 Tax=Pseudolycoriella hygida TaxID=35572 RepID=A0A9Q0S0A6_9DIPT|nr:hypothetical protein Bhyg_11815 [Pseudolycoriella hygida]
MKLVFCFLLVLRCMRTFCATTCEKNLENIKAEFTDFLNKFETDHALAYNNVKAILSSSETTSAAIKKLQSVREAECDVPKFLDNFFEARLRALGLAAPILYQYYLLLYMVDDFKCQKKLLCKSKKKFSSKCDAETNELSCSVQKLLDELESAGNTSKQKLFDFMEGSDKKNKLGLSFHCASSNVKGNKNSSKKTFVKKFAKLVLDNEVRLKKIVKVSDHIIKKIKDWKHPVGKC